MGQTGAKGHEKGLFSGRDRSWEIFVVSMLGFKGGGNRMRSEEAYEMVLAVPLRIA